MRLIYLLLLLLVLFQSCSSNKLISENDQLKLKIAGLEHRVYELTESPDFLAKEVLHDVDLLMTIPYQENLEMAQTMIQTFKTTYPNNKFLPDLIKREEEIAEILKSSNWKSGIAIGKNQMDQEESVKLQFSVQVNEKSLRFISVNLNVQNLSGVSLSNIWIKASLIDKSGENYGITQDFFFSRLNPFEYKSETLSWEYVQKENIDGIVLKQLRYSKNRQFVMLSEQECLIGDGNVKIFLEF